MLYSSSFALSFGNIDPASFVLQLDMEKGHFTILWSCSGCAGLLYLSHCVFLTSPFHLTALPCVALPMLLLLAAVCYRAEAVASAKFSPVYIHSSCW